MKEEFTVPHCENCEAIEAEMARLWARLNDPHWLIQRGLALLSGMRGPAV